MYVPTNFRQENVAELHALMRSYPFALLVTSQEEKPFATHLPFLLDTERGEYGTLRGHLARANPHWQQFDESREALVVFQGPHAYVSPAWYTVSPAVPTWNYAVVHAYGVVRIVGEEGLYTILRDSLTTFDPDAEIETLPEDFVARMMRSIVGFEIEITRLEGKAKMSQNKSREDQERVIAALEQSSAPLDRETGLWMQERLPEVSAPVKEPISTPKK